MRASSVNGAKELTHLGYWFERHYSKNCKYEGAIFDPAKLPPAPAQAQFDDPRVLLAFLAFLSVMLRIWATAGELLLAGISYAADSGGATGRSDAPGRIDLTAPRTSERVM